MEGDLSPTLDPEDICRRVSAGRIEEHVAERAARAQGVGGRVLQQDQTVHRGRPNRPGFEGGFLEVPCLLVWHNVLRPVVQQHSPR